MGLKAKVEAIIYAAEEPITAEQIAALLKDMVLAEEAEEKAKAEAAAQDAAEATGDAEPIVADATEAEAPSVEEAAPAEVAPEGEAVPEVVEEAAAEATDEALAAEEPAAEFTAVPADPKAPSGLEENAEASVTAPDPVAGKRKKPTKKELTEDGRITARIRVIIEELIQDYQDEDRGMEVSAVAGGFRMATKPEHHDVVRAFAKSLKPPIKFSLAALETLAVIAYKQPVTVPEISEIRGVESGGVIGTLLDRKLITTAGRKQVVGRPILYKTSKEFLLRFGLGGLSDLPSMEEFEKLAVAQEELFRPEPETQMPVEPLQAEEEQPVEQLESAPEPAQEDEAAPATDSVEAAEPAETQAEEPAPEAAAEESQPTNTSESKPE
jgi:segregation and condensation protein B